MNRLFRPFPRPRTHALSACTQSPISKLKVQIFSTLPVFTLLWALGLSPTARAAADSEQTPSTSTPSPRFLAVDVTLDTSTQPLAAYQLTFVVTNVQAKIVGIEGGDALAFREPPYYDPKALQHERVILAAFSTAPVDQLPRGRTRVATIHLQVEGAADPACVLTVQTAADTQARSIPVQAVTQLKNKP